MILLELCVLKNNLMHFLFDNKLHFHIHKNYGYISLFKCGMSCHLCRKIMLMVKEPKTVSNDFS